MSVITAPAPAPTDRPVSRMESLLRARELGIALAIIIVFGLTTLNNHSFAQVASIQQLLSGAALIVLLRLGRGFAIMPEARELKIVGPYKLVRHPLYVCEAIISVGLILQFQEPWALTIAVVGFLFMYMRTVFEERILATQYPQYAAYRARTCAIRDAAAGGARTDPDRTHGGCIDGKLSDSRW